jgi:hypothetical protein
MPVDITVKWLEINYELGGQSKQWMIGSLKVCVQMCGNLPAFVHGSLRGGFRVFTTLLSEA